MFTIILGLFLQLLGGTLFSAGLLGGGLRKISDYIRQLAVQFGSFAYIITTTGILVLLVLSLVLAILTGYPISEQHLGRFPARIPSPAEIAWWERFREALSE
jgi:hypothetical protein